MENKYGLYLSREGMTVRLPVNPESYSITQDNDNGNYNVLGIGALLVRPPAWKSGAWRHRDRRGLPAAEVLY